MARCPSSVVELSIEVGELCRSCTSWQGCTWISVINFGHPAGWTAEIYKDVAWHCSLTLGRPNPNQQRNSLTSISHQSTRKLVFLSYLSLNHVSTIVILQSHEPIHAHSSSALSERLPALKQMQFSLLDFPCSLSYLLHLLA